MKRLILALAVLSLAAPAWAGEGSYDVVAFTEPASVAVVLTREADFAAVPVSVYSEQKDPAQRFAEIREAKALIQQRAEGNPDIIVRPGPVSLSEGLRPPRAA